MKRFTAFCNTESHMQHYECQVIINNIGVDGCLWQEIKYLHNLGIKTKGCCCGCHIDKQAAAYIQVIPEQEKIMEILGYKAALQLGLKRKKLWIFKESDTKLKKRLKIFVNLQGVRGTRLNYEKNYKLSVKIKFPYKKGESLVVFMGGKRLPRRIKKKCKKYYKERFMGNVIFRCHRPVSRRKTVKPPACFIIEDFC